MLATESRMGRIGGSLTGLAGSILTMAGISLYDFGGLGEVAGIDLIGPTTSGSSIVRAISEHSDRIELGLTLGMFGLFFLVVFFSYFWSRLEGAEANRWMATTALAGGLIVVVLLAVNAALTRASVLTDWMQGDNTVIAKAFTIIDRDYFENLAPFISAHLIGAGAAILGSRLLPRWIGWGAIVVALAPIVSPPGLMTGVFMIWIFVISGWLLAKGIRNKPSSADT